MREWGCVFYGVTIAYAGYTLCGCVPCVRPSLGQKMVDFIIASALHFAFFYAFLGFSEL